MKKLILLEFFFVLVLSEDHCMKYSCSNEFQNKESCMKFNSREVYLKACEKDMVCDTNRLKGNEATCAGNYSSAKFYPGEYCRSHSECFSNNCTNQTCRGFEKNKSCTESWECKEGLHCSNYGCVETFKNDSKCQDEEDCDANLVCSSGICTKIGSKEINKTATVPEACKSFYVEGGLCKEAPKLKSFNETHCEYTNEEVVKSICGLTELKKKYCPAAPGDVDIQDVSCSCNFN
jgi:hypothetical protein